MLAPTNQNRTFPVSRKWQTVSKAIQRLRRLVCMRSRARECSLTRLTTCRQPMKKSSDCTSGKQRWMSTCAGSSAQREHQSAMTVLSISEAAVATGLNKTTVLRSIKSGKISGTRDPLGQWQIDAAELHRVQ